MQNEIIVGQKAIVAKIAGIKRAGKALDNAIQLCGLSVINHVELHGDVSLANRLVEAMPKGSRVNALLAWFEEFGKLKYKDAETGLVFAKSKTTNLEGADEKPWFDFKVEPPYKGFDLKAQVAALVKRAIAAADEEDPERAAKNKIDLETLESLKNLA